MRGVVCLLASAIITLSNVVHATPQIADAELRKSAEELSASTLVDGKGWTVAERLLHPEYARWAMGQIYERREKFVRSLEEWWSGHCSSGQFRESSSADNVTSAISSSIEASARVLMPSRCFRIIMISKASNMN